MSQKILAQSKGENLVSFSLGFLPQPTQVSQTPAYVPGLDLPVTVPPILKINLIVTGLGLGLLERKEGSKQRSESVLRLFYKPEVYCGGQCYHRGHEGEEPYPM